MTSSAFHSFHVFFMHFSLDDFGSVKDNRSLVSHVLARCVKPQTKCVNKPGSSQSLFPGLLWSQPSSDTGYCCLALTGRLPHRREGKESYSHLRTLFGSLPWRRKSKFSSYQRRTWASLWSVNNNTAVKLWCVYVSSARELLFITKGYMAAKCQN